MKTASLYTNCLTYDELFAYTNNKIDSPTRARLYQHIATCELCTCAVNGFTSMPSASIDINTLYDKIDMKTNVKQTGITFGQLCIVIVSLSSIVAFYFATNSIQQHSSKSMATTHKEISFSHLNVECTASPTVTPEATTDSKTMKHMVKKEETNTSELNSTYAYQETEKMD
ncbi:MAG TPA: hypothetical protein VFF27_04445, partial [Bacteroidia bacterium]|nr:hypothetical protein [Bacteroidia bacterium]